MKNEKLSNKTISISIGSIVAIVIFVWSAFGLGRPMFEADLAAAETRLNEEIVNLESDIDALGKNTQISFLKLELSQLKRELRQLHAEMRKFPDDEDLAEEEEEIMSEIDDVEDDISCLRSKDCVLEDEF